jgi:flavin reductase (DIM6/NTAB) family NADH-FMN oxidoreductase RutF
VDEDLLRDVLARLPAGVYLVSTAVGTGFRGITATSVSSVSLQPPLLLVCLDRLAAARDALLEHGAFSASLLSRTQQFLADRFAGQAPLADPSWRDVAHRLGGNGLPIVEGCAAWLECQVERVYEAGDHDIVVAAVIDGGRGQGEPLVHWERDFWGLAPT